MKEKIAFGNYMKETSGERNKKRREKGLETDVIGSLRKEVDTSLNLPKSPLAPLPELPKVPLTQEQIDSTRDPADVLADKLGNEKLESIQKKKKQN